MPILTSKKIQQFQSTVYDHYAHHERNLPWRHTRDPYKIIVSEVMLQQTQVSRVIEKYQEFLRAFPTLNDLAGASLSRILMVWQGLGYNRRALALKRLADIIVLEHKGRIPCDREKLRLLPGIGEATSGAISAFAFNRPEVFIETNIRSVFLRYFFNDKAGIHDKELLPLISLTLDTKCPRRWYNALMDYGVYLKSTLPNPSRKSLHYKRQERFAGSNRQIRGAIIKELTTHSNIRVSVLCARLGFAPARIKKMIRALLKEGLVKKTGDVLST